MHRSALKSVGFGSCPERKAAHGLIPGQAQAVAFKVFSAVMVQLLGWILHVQLSERKNKFPQDQQRVVTRCLPLPR